MKPKLQLKYLYKPQNDTHRWKIMIKLINLSFYLKKHKKFYRSFKMLALVSGCFRFLKTQFYRLSLGISSVQVYTHLCFNEFAVI